MQACNTRARPAAGGGPQRHRALTPRVQLWQKQEAGVAPRASGDERSNSVPPELERLFRDTQRNVLKLNDYRLKAQEEQRKAQLRIKELEGKLTDGELFAGDTRRLMQTLPGGDDALHEAAGQGYDAPPSSSEPLPSITVLYNTGWSRAYLHYNADKQGWTSLPGEEMASTKSGARSLTVAANTLEFVLTNGEGGWDTPDPYGSGKKNYSITSPGMYSLKSGKLSQLA